MRHRLPRRARPGRARALCTATKAAVLTTLAVLALGTGPGAEPGAALGGSRSASLDADQLAATPATAVERQMGRHDCSATGFADQQPRSALVRSADGRVRFVDFETGWRVYTRHGAATLLAVCLDEPPARVSPVSR